MGDCSIGPNHLNLSFMLTLARGVVMKNKNVCPKTRLRCEHLEGCQRGNCLFGAGALVPEEALSKADLYKLRMSEKPKADAPS